MIDENMLDDLPEYQSISGYDLEEIRADLLARGYEERAPDEESYAIDNQVTLESACSDCGSQLLTYHPFSRENPRSYKALVKCGNPDCGLIEEF